jgi:DNA polymerase I-like protein with 3'-5' exonuclease and polymerase domains
MITVDFETESIVGNPLVNPPVPVGVALYVEGSPPEYLPIDANSKEKLRQIWGGNEPLLFHNAPFDLSVAERHLGLPHPRDWRRVHDTVFQVFLRDPYAESLSLKPSAAKYLGMLPEEQDELRDWILANTQALKTNWGGYISKAPFELVSKYAVGDVLRTHGLYAALSPSTPTAAYDRERRLAPILTESSRHGIRVDRAALEMDTEQARAALQGVDELIRQRLNAPGLNPGSGSQLAAALKSSGVMTEFKKTPTGRDSTSKKNLLATLPDKELLEILVYRGTLETIVGTFMEPWLEFSRADNRLHTNWNQVRGEEQPGYSKGTRTGRLSSDHPNFQNPPKEPPPPPPEGFSPIPEMRKYLLPEEGHKWIMRDFSGQEVRVLAHFEDDILLAAYKENPDLDPHAYAQELIRQKTGKTYERKAVKITAFSVIYGAGGQKIADSLGVSLQEGYEIKNAYLAAFPGVGDLQRGTSAAGRSGAGITTWGGRHYHAEPPKMVNGKYRSFEYKLLNYLIQGSSADQTKQCLNDWYEVKDSDTIFLATVHDEINASVPEDMTEREMEVLRVSMDQDLFDCPMKSAGAVGNSWWEAK